MDLIYCRGGNRLDAEAARLSGVLYGTRYNYTAYGDVYMLDGGIGYIDWPRYLRRVDELHPVMALTPDWYAPLDPDWMYARIDDLRRAGVPKIAVCPKFAGAVHWIPTDCIIAVSVPSTYAGFLPDPDEVGSRPVHLLGGAPDQVYLLSRRYANVITADMNIMGRKARLGQYWAETGGWKAVPSGSVPTLELIVRSWVNIRHYLNRQSVAFTSKRTQRLLSVPLL